MLRRSNLALANSTEQFAGDYARVFPGHTKSRKGLVGKDAMQSQGKINTSPKEAQSVRSLLVCYMIVLSQLSMHFERDLRLSLARRLKLLLNEENWDDEEQLPSQNAFLTLLRCMLVMGAKASPSIGSNGRGSLSATWIAGSNRITLECGDRDKVSFVLSRKLGDAPTEQAAGHTTVERLAEILAPYQPEVWFNNA